MNRQAILHAPMSEYAHGLDDNHIVFRLRAAKGDLTASTLIYGDRACRRTPVDYFSQPMEKVAEDLLYDWFETCLCTPFKRVCYAFRLTDTAGETVLYYGNQFCESLTVDRSEYFQLPYNHRADRVQLPSWTQDAIVYNIFPDSFATAWRSIVGQGTQASIDGEVVRGRLGGTLKGVESNLDYIRDLGFNCIYLNPIFAAGEYHKYDVIDYLHIDPVFGTNDDFFSLVQSAHAMGLRVMIDGVFNHCGWRFFAFRDVMEKGRASAYWDWFYHLEEPVRFPKDMDTYPTYECFGYERLMPKLATDHPDVERYFCHVGEYWVREFDIDGWRLDVASEVNDGFWRAFRKAVKSVKPDCVLIGEVWESAAHWLDGTMFDSTMNYDFRRHSLPFFAKRRMDAQSFNARVTDMLMRYRRPVAFCQLNLLDSHDVSRFLSLCGEDERKLKLAVVFQMTFVGMPCVFYGDELGMTGVSESEYRQPMRWEKEHCELHTFYTRAIALRNSEPALRRGSFHMCFAQAQGGVYCFMRIWQNTRITVTINCAATPYPVQGAGQLLWQNGWDAGVLCAYGFLVCKEVLE